MDSYICNSSYTYRCFYIKYIHIMRDLTKQEIKYLKLRLIYLPILPKQWEKRRQKAKAGEDHFKIDKQLYHLHMGKVKKKL